MKIIPQERFKGKILPQLINRRKKDEGSVSSSVRKIVNDVKENGNEALFRYTQKFDGVLLSESEMKATKSDFKEAYNQLKKRQVDALKKAAKNILRFHKRQMVDPWSQEIEEGVTVGRITRPLSSIGVYVPGGRASYPSSLLMCAIPAAVAGVPKTIACCPPKKTGEIDPALLVAADLSEVTEVYSIGGAQAIAAMAYGTETVPQVDKIVGPGNAFVTAAKMEVSRDVAIDLPAGPSEILIIADETADPRFIASDLLAQAEHDPQALTILLTPSQEIASAVKEEVDKQMKSLSRIQTVRSSMERWGLIVVLKDMEEVVSCTNSIAPEHLQIQTKSPKKILEKIQNAGAVFLGKYSPVAFGDYSSGLNHVLPTGGYAKIYSGLSTSDFLKTINFLKCSKKGCQRLKKTTVTLAEMEGFDGHAKSVSIRDERNEN
ncbi:MAG: histidinol dehydrogenase [Thermoproteota archaeon]